MREEKTHLLLVEDDPSLGYVIKDNLQDFNFLVRWEKDGVAGFEQFFSNYFDVCVLDVMLPKKDGFTLAKEIRKINPDVPILFLTAKGMIEDKAEGFGSGGDDYLTKPFAMEELVARIEAVLNRAERYPKKPNSRVKEIYEFGDTLFDFNNLQLTIKEETNTLTTREAELLRLLCLNINQHLEREVALKLIWGANDYFLGRSMDVFIARLRKYLNDSKDLEIETIPKVGFMLKAQKA